MTSPNSRICPSCGKALVINGEPYEASVSCATCGAQLPSGLSRTDTDVTPSRSATDIGVPPSDSTAPQEWNIGAVLLNLYVITDILGEGGMGKVYKAHHLRWDIDLAIKCPKPQLINNNRAMDAFQQECETWVNLGLHPHITTCYYVRRLGGLPRIFAEYVDGKSLRKWITKRALYKGGPAAAFERILAIAIQIAWGLHHAHESGLVHRDVKSSNVLMSKTGTAKVTDFGLASARIQLAQLTGKDTSDMLASAGGMTPAYCSPEQHRHEQVSRKTDIWSWALCVLEMLAGGVVWSNGPDAPNELIRIYREGPSHEAAPRMPPSLLELLTWCCQPNPSDRPEDMMAVAGVLRNIHNDILDKPYEAEPPRPMVTRVESLNNRAVSLVDLGHQAEAERALIEALKVEPQHAEATFNLGLLRWRTGRLTDEAFVHRIREIAETQRSELSLQLLAQVHLERGDYNAAIKVLQNSKEAQSSGTAQLKDAAQRRLPYARMLRGAIEAHADVIHAVHLSPDDSYVLSSSEDNTIQLSEIIAGAGVRTFQGHSGSVQSIALRADGKQALSASCDRTVRLWDIETGDTLTTLKYDHAGLNCVASTADFAPIAAGALDGKVIIWPSLADSRRRIVDAHASDVTAIAMNKEAEITVSGARDGSIRIWDLMGAECVKRLECKNGSVLALAISSCGRYVLSGGSDHLLQLWDIESGDCIRTLRGHNDEVTAVQITADRRHAVSSAKDGTVRLWKLNTGCCLYTYRGHHGEVRCADIASKGHLLASGGTDKIIRLWSSGFGVKPFVAPMVLCRALHSETAVSTELAFAKTIEEGKQALARGDIPTATERIRQARSMTGFRRNAAAMQLWWRLYRRLPRTSLDGFWEGETIEGHIGIIRCLDLSWDGRFILSGGSDYVIRLWDSLSGKCLRQYDGHAGAIYSLRLTQDNRSIVSASEDGTIKVWDTRSGECIRTFQEQAGGLETIVLSPDERFVASSGWSIILWDMAEGRNLRTFGGQTAAVFGLAWTPDSRCLLSGASDEELRVWDVIKGNCLQALGGHNGAVSAVSVSADCQHAITASSPVWGRDGEIMLWDMRKWQRIRTFDGHTGAVNAAVISLDGRLILSGGSDGTVRLWSTETGQCIRVLTDSLKGVRDVRLSPDCRLAAAADEDGIIQLWILDWNLGDKPDAEWDPAVEPYLDVFLESHRPYGGVLPADDYPEERELVHALTRKGKPTWDDNDFGQLLYLIGCAGYGWIDPAVIQAYLLERQHQSVLGWLGSRFGTRRR